MRENPEDSSGRRPTKLPIPPFRGPGAGPKPVLRPSTTSARESPPAGAMPPSTPPSTPASMPAMTAPTPSAPELPLPMGAPTPEEAPPVIAAESIDEQTRAAEQEEPGFLEPDFSGVDVTALHDPSVRTPTPAHASPAWAAPEPEPAEAPAFDAPAGDTAGWDSAGDEGMAQAGPSLAELDVAPDAEPIDGGDDTRGGAGALPPLAPVRAESPAASAAAAPPAPTTPVRPVTPVPPAALVAGSAPAAEPFSEAYAAYFADTPPSSHTPQRSSALAQAGPYAEASGVSPDDQAELQRAQRSTPAAASGAADAADAGQWESETAETRRSAGYAGYDESSQYGDATYMTSGYQEAIHSDVEYPAAAPAEPAYAEMTYEQAAQYYAEVVAGALESVAYRVRTGEIQVAPVDPQAGEVTALVAALAALMGVRG